MKPLVRRSFKLEKRTKLIWVIDESVENTFFDILRRDQAMGVILRKAGNAGKHLPPTPPRIKKLANPQHRGYAAFDHVL